MEEAGSEGGDQVGGREGSVTSVAIAEDFSLESSCSGTLMGPQKSFDDYYVSRSIIWLSWLRVDHIIRHVEYLI